MQDMCLQPRGAWGHRRLGRTGNPLNQLFPMTGGSTLLPKKNHSMLGKGTAFSFTHHHEGDEIGGARGGRERHDLGNQAVVAAQRKGGPRHDDPHRRPHVCARQAQQRRHLLRRAPIQNRIPSDGKTCKLCSQDEAAVLRSLIAERMTRPVRMLHVQLTCTGMAC